MRRSACVPLGVAGLAVATLFAAGTGQGLAQSRAGTGESAELYQQYCAACHGAELRGGMGPSLIDDEWSYGGSDAEIIASIAQGRGVMPGFAAQLSEMQIRSLLYFIREMRILADRAALTPPPDPESVTYQTQLHDFRLQKIASTDTGAFWSVDFLPDGQLLVPEKSGRLWLIDADGTKTLVTGTPEALQSVDGGMFEAVAHPDYASNGWIYLAYLEGRHLGEAAFGSSQIPDVRGQTRVIRGRIRDGQWVDEETLFEFRPEHHEQMRYRFGCRITFRDGYMYFSIGDGGLDDAVQDVRAPMGKVFRLHDDGRIPEDNPFVGVPGAYEAVWTYGNRHVQGFAWQPGSGLLFATEHGPRGGDEVNILRKGRNYGWPVITYGINYDGTIITDRTEAPGMEQPLHYWAPSIAPAGIDFYTGELFPQWRDSLFVTGLASEQLHRLTVEGEEVVGDEIVLRGIGRLRDIATAPDGSLYLVVNTRSPDTGTIYRMTPASPAPPGAESPGGEPRGPLRQAILRPADGQESPT